jgi:hypothetical protein
MSRRDAVDREAFERVVGMPAWTAVEKRFKKE